MATEQQQVGPTPVYVFSENGERINVAAIHPLLAAAEAWVEAHEEWYGRLQIAGILRDNRYRIGVPDTLWIAERDAFEAMRTAIGEARASGEEASGG